MRIEAGSDEFKALRDAGKIIRVFLEGEEVSKARMADDEAGIIERAVLDADGRVQIDPTKPDQIWYETVRGAVRIEIVDEAGDP